MNNFLHKFFKSLAVVFFVSSQTVAFSINTKLITAHCIYHALDQSAVYDPLGAVTALVDRATQRADFTYELSRTATATRYLNNAPVTETIARDWQLNEKTVADALSRDVESYTLDAQGRVKTVTNLEGQVMTFNYLVGALVASVTRFDGVTVSFTYDSSGRLIKKNYSGNAPFNETHTYLANGLPVSAANATSSVSWEYDAYGRVITEIPVNTDPVYALPQGKNHYNYDADGNVVNATTVCNYYYTQNATAYKWTHSNFNHRVYDSAGRITSQTVPEGTFTYHYDARGNLAALSNSVLRVNYAYDSLNRLTGMVYRNASGAQVAAFGYTLDDLGRAIQAVQTVGATTRVKNYSYDSLGRLAWTDDIAPGTLYPQSNQPQTQSYDLAGNRLNTGYGILAHTHNKISSPGFSHNSAG